MFLNSAAPDTESSAASGPHAGGRDKDKPIKWKTGLDKTEWGECHETFQEHIVSNCLFKDYLIMSFLGFLNYFNDNQAYSISNSHYHNKYLHFIHAIYLYCVNII